MAGTNALAYKQALVAAAASAPIVAADGIQVEYDWPGRVERELIHGGRVEGTQSYPVSRGGGGRMPRDEELQVDLNVVVASPGTTPEETETRAVQIGTEIENWLAEHLDLGGISGVIYSGVVGVEMETSVDDDGTITVLTYRHLLKSRLT
jgi:hypothetical protein